MRNAIPRHCEVVRTLPAENVQEFCNTVNGEWADTLRDEYGYIEHALNLTAEPTALPAELVPEEVQDALVGALMACHNGVLRFIPHLPTIVETSANLAIVEIGEGKAFFKDLVRSSSDSQRQCCCDTIEAAFALAGMKVEFDGAYPAWQPSPASPIVELMREVYRELFNEEAHVQVCHAGLECSVILSHCPGMDVVSFGPTLRSPHTPDERVLIDSVGKYYNFVLETLKRIPKK